jgi:uncharacterized membrane protein YoaK (UPF0700 family)
MPYRVAGQDPQARRRERPWVFAGGTLLAAIAGFVNVCVLGFFQVPVSHMTGAVSRLSLDVEAGNQTDLRLVLSIVGGFLLGAMLSGLLIGGRKLVPGRRYGVALVLEGVALAGATWLLVRGSPVGVPLAALACGIQNAMASSYNGLILRTTHVTGIVTDIGVMLGHWLRHGRIRRWNLTLLLGLLGSFFAGGVLGAVTFRWAGMAALAAPALVCLLAGTGYIGWRQRLHHAGHTPLGVPKGRAAGSRPPAE